MAKLEPSNSTRVGEYILNLTHFRDDTEEVIERKNKEKRRFKENSTQIVIDLGVTNEDGEPLDKTKDTVIANQNTSVKTHLMIPHKFMVTRITTSWDANLTFEENYSKYDDIDKATFTKYIFGHKYISNLLPGVEPEHIEELFALYARITTNSAEKQDFIDNAARRLKEVGVRMADTKEVIDPSSHTIIVHEDTENDTFVVIPDDLNVNSISESDLEGVKNEIGDYYFKRCR